MLELLLDQLSTMKIELAVARAKEPIRDVLDDSGLSRRIGDPNFHANVEAAVHACAARNETA
jgi:hypothetical protein